MQILLVLSLVIGLSVAAQGKKDNAPGVDVCALNYDTGPCRAYMPRYFYNSASGKCEKFTYGGCDGNENNFETIEDCKNRCSKKQRSVEVCNLEPDVGPCDGAFRRYYFDSKSGECKEFTYGGCGGNANNFESLDECRDKCSGRDKCSDKQRSVEVCNLEPEVGPCEAAFRRYYFDSKSGECKEFTYGGCCGNANNFDSLDECRDKCSG